MNQNFKNYLENETLKNHKLNLGVAIRTPAQEKGLQVVDFVSWAIFRNLEAGDQTYYNLIKNKIVEESSLYPL